MTKLQPYKGYAAEIEIDVDADVLSGRVIGMRDVIHFEGTTVSEATLAFHTTVDEYLAWCKELGEEPDKPYSGNVMVRMNPSLHRRLAVTAEHQGSSINSIVISAIEQVIHDPDKPPARQAEFIRIELFNLLAQVVRPAETDVRIAQNLVFGSCPSSTAKKPGEQDDRAYTN